MIWTIYKITDHRGKVYIGMTSRTLAQRWKEHKNDTKSGRTDSRLHKAMRKYGFGHFKMEEITQCYSALEASVCERAQIARYGTYAVCGGFGYNLTIGAVGAEGMRLSEESRRKISLSKIGKKRSPETIAKMRATILAMKHAPSSEARAKALAQRKGMRLPQEWKDKIAAAQKEVFFCPRGHSLSGDNLMLKKQRRNRRPTKVCRKCRREIVRRSDFKRRHRNQLSLLSAYADAGGNLGRA